MRRTVLLVCILVLVFAGACGLQTPLPPFLGFLGTATPTHTVTPSPTITPSPTATFTPTFTPTPTDTATPTFTPSNTPKPYVAPADNGYVSSVISLVNSERAAAGLPALTVNWTLVANSQAWSNYMASSDNFTHSGQNVGENIAAGYDSPGAVVSAWMSSDGHRANILNPNYTQVGAGYAYNANSTYGHYWTLQFLP